MRGQPMWPHHHANRLTAIKNRFSTLIKMMGDSVTLKIVKDER